MRTIDCRVYLQQHFPNTSVEAIARMVEEKYAALGTRALVLCRGSAMLLIWSGTPTQKGRNAELLQDKTVTAPIAHFVHGFLDLSKKIIHLHDPLCFWPPDNKYSVGLWLPYGETKKQFIRTGYEKAEPDAPPLVASFYFQNGGHATVYAKLAKVVAEWLADAATVGFAGEMLTSSSSGFEERADEFMFGFENYELVTFPWIELYLRVRADLERRDWPTALLFRCPNMKIAL